MSNGPHSKPECRIKGARGFKVKVFDTLHKQTCWYSKTYCSLRNVKLAIAHGGFDARQFYVRDEWDGKNLTVAHRSCVELFIYDVETWKLAAVRKGDGGTNIIALDECNQSRWSSRAGEWEDNVKTQEQDDVGTEVIKELGEPIKEEQK